MRREMDRLLDTEQENERIVLGLLNSVEHDATGRSAGSPRPRHRARLVNAYSSAA